MEKKEVSRRKFLKQAAIISAVGVVAVTSRGKAGSKNRVDRQILYRETRDWKAYYKTIKN